MALLSAAMLMLLSVACGGKRDNCIVPGNTIAEAERYLIDSLGEDYYTALPCVLSSFPESMKYDFTELCDSLDLSIRTTPDGKLRFYSFDTGEGGTMIDYQTLVQWSDDLGEIHYAHFAYPNGGDSEDNDSSDFIIGEEELIDDDNIATVLNTYQLPDLDGRPTYLVEAYMREMSTIGAYDVIAVQIIDGKPTAVPIFVDAEGKRHTDIGYEINIPYWFFTTKGRGWNWVNSFDPSTNSIYLPVMDTEGNMAPTGRYHIYTWNNGKMVYTRDGANFKLHPSLAEFESIEGIYYTPKYSIRIDKLNDNRYRIASWPLGTLQIEKPSVIYYGTKSKSDPRFFDFKNGNTTYRIPRPNYRGEQTKMYILKNDTLDHSIPIE